MLRYVHGERYEYSALNAANNHLSVLQYAESGSLLKNKCDKLLPSSSTNKVISRDICPPSISRFTNSPWLTALYHSESTTFYISSCSMSASGLPQAYSRIDSGGSPVRTNKAIRSLRFVTDGHSRAGGSITLTFQFQMEPHYKLPCLLIVYHFRAFHDATTFQYRYRVLRIRQALRPCESSSVNRKMRNSSLPLR